MFTQGELGNAQICSHLASEGKWGRSELGNRTVELLVKKLFQVQIPESIKYPKVNI